MVRIAIVGKYTKLGDAYKSIAEALTHGGIANNTKVIAEWIDSEIFEKENTAAYLQNFSAILVPGGFGERGAEQPITATQPINTTIIFNVRIISSPHGKPLFYLI